MRDNQEQILTLFAQIQDIAAKTASVPFRTSKNIGLGSKVRRATKAENKLMSATSEGQPLSQRRRSIGGGRKSLGGFYASRFSVGSERSSSGSDKSTKTTSQPAHKKKASELLETMDDIIDECGLRGEESKRVEELKKEHRTVHVAIRHLKQTMSEYKEQEEAQVEERVNQKVDRRALKMELERKQVDVEALEEQFARRKQQMDALDEEQRAQSERRKSNAERALELNDLEQQLMEVQSQLRKARAAAQQSQEELEAVETVVASARLSSPSGKQGSASPDTLRELIAVRKQECTTLEHECRILKESIAERMAEKQQLRDSDPRLDDARQQLAAEQQRLDKQNTDVEVIRNSCSALDNVMAHLIAQQAQANNPMAVVLDIIQQHNGEMLLSDFKLALAERLALKAGSKILQIVYSAVANGFIKIDRTQMENTVLAAF